MEMLALLLVFPLAWPFVAKAIWRHEYTFGELALNIVLVVAVVTAGYMGGRFNQSADYEVVNGQVTDKTSEHVRCSHSYDCRCSNVCSGTGKNRSCTKKCDTCYEHSYDVDWTLETSVGNIDVNRVDRRGTSEPPRWTRAQVGDPVAQTHLHTNYIKGAPESLFSAVAEQTTLKRHEATLPDYPLDVRDLHYLNRALTAGVAVPDLADWNSELALRLRNLGPSKQVNWVVVFTKNNDPLWADALRVKWLGGKKNDVVVVLGTPEYPKLGWVRVLSWTDKELFKIQLRDELQALQTVDRKQVLDVLEKNVSKSFERKHMKDFEYLANQIQPPGWLVALLFVVSVAGSVGLSLYLSRNEVRSYPSGRFPFRRSFR